VSPDTLSHFPGVPPCSQSPPPSLPPSHSPSLPSTLPLSLPPTPPPYKAIAEIQAMMSRRRGAAVGEGEAVCYTVGVGEGEGAGAGAGAGEAEVQRKVEVQLSKLLVLAEKHSKAIESGSKNFHLFPVSFINVRGNRECVCVFIGSRQALCPSLPPSLPPSLLPSLGAACERAGRTGAEGAGGRPPLPPPLLAHQTPHHKHRPAPPLAPPPSCAPRAVPLHPASHLSLSSIAGVFESLVSVASFTFKGGAEEASVISRWLPVVCVCVCVCLCAWSLFLPLVGVGLC
jgi:hypothetical protein